MMRKMYTFGLAAVVLGLVAGMTVRARAGQLALDFTGGLPATTTFDSNRGWGFAVNSTITIDALGTFDFGSDGLVSNHEVGLWSNNGPTPVLLASTDVTNASTPIGSTSTAGRWLFNSIPLLTLTPGQYAIAAIYLDTPVQDQFMYDATASTVPQVTYEVPRLSMSGTLSFPDQTYPAIADACFGPNFLTVPEPSSIVLLCLGLGGLALLDQRRKQGRSAEQWYQH
jgi:hypothetical protein